MSVLNLEDYTPNVQNFTKPSGDQLAKFQKVKTIGIIALILAIVGIVIPFVADLTAFFLARWSMSLSRQTLAPIEYDRPALWAYRVSIMGMVLWVIAIIRIIL